MKDRPAASKSFQFLEYSPLGSTPESTHDVSVNKGSFWSYCGPLLTDAEAIPSSLHDWTSATLSDPLLPLLLPFLAFANDFIAENGLDHYWLTIRATKATAEFNKPRWHTDDLFFSRDTDQTSLKSSRGGLTKPKPSLDLSTDWKLCTTLLGPPTVFIPAERQASARATLRATKRALATEHACSSIRCVGCAATADAVRERLSAELAPLGRVQASPGQCAFFRIGQERGAVHSEPCMGEGDRVFVNVVPGTEKELEGLVRRWGMGFPRSWWVAPGVLRDHNGT
ncbi:hypothetical protein F4821DRAFT_114929 [Hypoxylon rubiginosum]|uniref:Uncharacterized protein n=1 Tax=Hypoxylon rubiginosum TaxID=110542 RepID=A0ACC0DKB4_9PEZI|nr:hypothetical protein F4821DRAFT_114929 [Hypoxylon rubiginosum]